MVNSPQNPRQELDLTSFSASSGEPVEWRISDAPVPYPEAVAEMEARFPVYRTGRGGQFTYHGPGQRVAYAMLDLKRRNPDVRAYVCDLEEWLIQALAELGVKGERRTGRVGIWVQRGTREDKIAALGVRSKHWVSLHGVALNVDPDLSHFTGIVPGGVTQHGVTSLADLGIVASMADVDVALKRSFGKIFG